jgi:hypothetical protein
MMGFGGGPAAIGSITPTQWATDQASTFQAEASALGISESAIVSGWAQGESLAQIATANGISQTQYQADMKTYEQSQTTADLQALVSAGTITQDQMNQYLQTVATRQAQLQAQMQNASGTWEGRGGGFGRRHGIGAGTTTQTSNSNSTQ